MAVAVKSFWRQYHGLAWEKKILVSAAFLALIPVMVTLLWPSTPEALETHSRRAEVDTFIPKGFVLVPIEVQNYEALDSVLGRFAVVDLFQGGTPDAPHEQLVARNVRLLRAPQNPAHFAVLVQESMVAQILRSGVQFTVIVKRPGESGTEFVKAEKVTHRRIVYDGGSNP